MPLLNLASSEHGISQIPDFLPLKLECSDIKRLESSTFQNLIRGLVTDIFSVAASCSCYLHQLGNYGFFSLTYKIVYDILSKSDSVLSYSTIISMAH